MKRFVAKMLMQHDRRAAKMMYWSCGRKTPYKTMESAMTTIPPDQYPYLCPFCSQWHRATRRG